MAFPSTSDPLLLPTPGDILVDEGGSATSWLASAYDPATIRDEWDWLFEDESDRLEEIWFTCRPTTPEELADEDFVYDEFGDVEMNGVDTSTVYSRVPPNTPGAHRYWTVDL